jgi:hypothetical protein
LSKIARLLFITASTSHCSISITLRCASTIIYTSVACHTFNCSSVDNCSSFTTTFSSLASFCTVYASTKCCSSTSSSPNSSMHIKFTNVALHPVYFLACQCRLFLRKNSIANVLIVSMFWIIVCANCIFSLYTFPSTHFKDDDECISNLITNGYIFNTPFLFALSNPSSTFVLLNNYASSSCLCLCSPFYASFSLAICCSFSIALILLRIPKLWKCAQLPATNANYFQQLPHFF